MQVNTNSAFAVVWAGGKQYRVQVGDKVKIEKCTGEPGQEIVLDKVLMVGNGTDVQVGAPYISNKVTAKILDHDRDKKIIVQKFKRRKKYRRRQGHRQHFTRVEILSI